MLKLHCVFCWSQGCLVENIDTANDLFRWFYPLLQREITLHCGVTPALPVKVTRSGKAAKIGNVRQEG